MITDEELQELRAELGRLQVENQILSGQQAETYAKLVAAQLGHQELIARNHKLFNKVVELKTIAALRDEG